MKLDEQIIDNYLGYLPLLGVSGSVRILQPVVRIHMPTIRNFEVKPWNQEGSTWEHIELDVSLWPSSTKRRR
jgi:hypothetical protein